MSRGTCLECGGMHLLTNGMAWCPVSHKVLHSDGLVTKGSVTGCVGKREMNKKTGCLQSVTKYYGNFKKFV